MAEGDHHTSSSSSRRSTPPRHTPPRSGTPGTPHGGGGTPRPMPHKKSLPVFNSYMSLFQVQEKLKKGEVIEGVLRINPKNYEDAYISAPDGGTDIYIGGVRDRNAALHGDVVDALLLPPQHWKVLYELLDEYLSSHQEEKDTVYRPLESHLTASPLTTTTTNTAAFYNPAHNNASPHNTRDGREDQSDGRQRNTGYEQRQWDGNNPTQFGQKNQRGNYGRHGQTMREGENAGLTQGKEYPGFNQGNVGGRGGFIGPRQERGRGGNAPFNNHRGRGRGDAGGQGHQRQGGKGGAAGFKPQKFSGNNSTGHFGVQLQTDATDEKVDQLDSDVVVEEEEETQESKQDGKKKKNRRRGKKNKKGKAAAETSDNAAAQLESQSLVVKKAGEPETDLAARPADTLVLLPPPSIDIPTNASDSDCDENSQPPKVVVPPDQLSEHEFTDDESGCSEILDYDQMREDQNFAQAQWEAFKRQQEQENRQRKNDGKDNTANNGKPTEPKLKEIEATNPELKETEASYPVLPSQDQVETAASAGICDTGGGSPASANYVHSHVKHKPTGHASNLPVTSNLAVSTENIQGDGKSKFTKDKKMEISSPPNSDCNLSETCIKMENMAVGSGNQEFSTTSQSRKKKSVVDQVVASVSEVKQDDSPGTANDAQPLTKNDCKKIKHEQITKCEKNLQALKQEPVKIESSVTQNVDTSSLDTFQNSSSVQMSNSKHTDSLKSDTSKPNPSSNLPNTSNRSLDLNTTSNTPNNSNTTQRHFTNTPTNRTGHFANTPNHPNISHMDYSNTPNRSGYRDYNNTPNSGRYGHRTPNSNNASPGMRSPMGMVVTRSEPSVQQVMQLSNWEKFIQRTAEVVCIFQKRHTRMGAGTLKLFPDRNQNYAFFAPSDHRVPRMKVPMNQCPPDFYQRSKDYAKRIFLCKIVDWREPGFAIGELLRDVGGAGEVEAETEAILLEQGVDYNEFPDAATAHLPALPWSIPPLEISARTDLRKDCIFTIDPSSARDLDDALSCVRLPNGNFRVGVHIADVSFFIQPGSPLDLVAGSRATSVYLTDRVIPMLPRVLCEHLCSLNPDEDRLAFSVVWELKPSGEIVGEWMGRSVIRSCVKLAYEHAQSMIEEPERTSWGPGELPSISQPHTQARISQVVGDLHSIAVNLRKKRFRDGALRLDQVKVAFDLNLETMMPSGLFVYEYKDSNKLIEEFMLLANMAVAHRIYKHYPELSVLRRHPPPLENPLESAAQTLSAAGINLNVSSAGDLNKSITKYMGNDQYSVARLSVITNMCSKPMQFARYFCTGALGDETQFRHYALNVPLYTHFTSPIRRYADLMVHRLLAAAVEPQRYPLPPQDKHEIDRQCEQCNVKKQASKLVQEVSTELFLGLFVRLSGEMVEEAMVMGVLDRAFDVLVLKLGVVKRVYVEKLPLIRYNHEKSHKRVTLTLVWRPEDGRAPLVQEIILFSLVKVRLMSMGKESLKFNATLLRPS